MTKLKKPFYAVEQRADDATYYAQSAVDHLNSWGESVVLMRDPDHNFDHLLALQHWFQKGYYLAETSCIERDDGGYRGCILYRPSDMVRAPA